jgi:integrase
VSLRSSPLASLGSGLYAGVVDRGQPWGGREAALTQRVPERMVSQVPGPPKRRFPPGELAQHAQTYLSDIETEGKSAATIRDYRSTLRRLCEASIGRTLSEFDGPAGKRLLMDFLKSERPGVRRQKAKHLHAFFRWAEDYELIQRDPTRRLTMPREPAKRRTPQPEGRIQTIIDAQPFLNWRLAIMLGGMLGQRRGSVRGIQIRDFDLVNARVRIRLKGGRIVQNPIPYPEILLAVEQLVQDGWQPDWYLLHTVRKNNLPGRKSDWIVKPEEQMSDSAFSRWWRKCIERAGDVPYFDFHTLRTSAATRLYRTTKDLVSTARALNHAKVETTQQHYIDTDELTVVDAYMKAGWNAPSETARSADSAQQSGREAPSGLEPLYEALQASA